MRIKKEISSFCKNHKVALSCCLALLFGVYSYLEWASDNAQPFPHQTAFIDEGCLFSNSERKTIETIMEKPWGQGKQLTGLLVLNPKHSYSGKDLRVRAATFYNNLSFSSHFTLDMPLLSIQKDPDLPGYTLYEMH